MLLVLPWLVAIVLVVRTQLELQGTVRTQGTIVAVETGYGSNRAGNVTIKKLPTFEFTDASGVVHRVKTDTAISELQSGDAVTIAYDPAQPDRARLLHFWGLYAGAIIAAILGLFLGLIALVLKVASKPKQPLQ